jgi:predicted RNase H-like nuclease
MIVIPPSILVAGVDGCPGGWIAALWNAVGIEVRLATSLAEIYELGPTVLAVDIPVGLPDVAVRGGRGCDVASRAFLRAPRASSVFSPPARVALDAATHAEASAKNRASGLDAPGLSIQAFGLFPRLRDADGWVTAAMQDASALPRVVEAHPEVSFALLNGEIALRASKKKREGRQQRVDLLRRVLPVDPEACVAAYHGDRRVGADDVIDALACAWTAARVHAGTATCFSSPRCETDESGRAMQIWA